MKARGAITARLTRPNLGRQPMSGQLDAMKRRILVRKRREWVADAGPARPLVARPAAEPPACQLDAWLGARATAKKRPLTADPPRRP